MKESSALTLASFDVSNHLEHQRTAASSEVSDRALREIYLMPFMIAQRDAQPIAYMTRYDTGTLMPGLHRRADSLFLP